MWIFIASLPYLLDFPFTNAHIHLRESITHVMCLHCNVFWTMFSHRSESSGEEIFTTSKLGIFHCKSSQVTLSSKELPKVTAGKGQELQGSQLTRTASPSPNPKTHRGTDMHDIRLWGNPPAKSASCAIFSATSSSDFKSLLTLPR